MISLHESYVDQLGIKLATAGSAVLKIALSHRSVVKQLVHLSRVQEPLTPGFMMHSS